jgi:hypothetical protein
LAWWWLADSNQAWTANRGNSFQTSVVAFELWAWPQGQAARQISGLGFSQDNPFYWGLLPTDSVLYAPVINPAPPRYTALIGEIDHPRFPLARPTAPGLGLPLGMTALVRPDFTQGATLPGEAALQRDGLITSDSSGSLDPNLFIDPNLANSTSATLLQEAFYWQYQAQNAGPLQGIHALLGVDEVSMIVVPDAIHGGWKPATAEATILSPPDPVRVSLPDESGNYKVSWALVPDAKGYTLEESSDPTFATAVTSRDVGADVSISLSSNAQCPVELYYRVAAYGVLGPGPWSQTVSVIVGTGDFDPCSVLPLSAPQLKLNPEANHILLNWLPALGPVDAFTLQIAEDPQFESGLALYQGQNLSFQYWAIQGPPLYFRVNATSKGKTSPWSNTVNSPPQQVSPFVTVPVPLLDPQHPPLLLQVHKALLIMAAARGDLVAILSLPYSFRQSEALTYQSLLSATAVLDSKRTPSYGAVYHPWIVTPDNTNAPPQSLRTLVPDGAVCGAIAATTLSSGAWIAPANITVANAVAIEPSLESGTAEAFAIAQINLIAQQPEGFLITGQDTLIATDSDLQPMNVRRLLILLRRLAVREGVRYVFQNISPSFQRAITRQFEQWMQLLLARGAFAGASAQDSYQVIADATVNPQIAIEQGQFVVELRVAPSVPMRFLTVKLIQSGGQLTLVEG